MVKPRGDRPSSLENTLFIGEALGVMVIYLQQAKTPRGVHYTWDALMERLYEVTSCHA